MWKSKSTTPAKVLSMVGDAAMCFPTAQIGSRRLRRLALALPVLLFAGVAGAQYPPYGQYPLLDEAANRVVQKYQNSSCEQLWQQRGQPRSQREQEAIQFLRNDPQMRAAFINRVAAPIANKMFECGLIP
jgi:hypothetical protein